MVFSINPLSSLIGAEVDGLDICAPLQEADRQSLRDALSIHQVLTIRDQSLTPNQFVEFCRNFGELEPFFINAYSLPESPEIYVLSNVRRDGRPIGRDGAGTHWHTDHTFHREPASVTLLYAVEVPVDGGDTLFADMRGAYDELPAEMKRRLEGLRAIHRYQKKEHLYTADGAVSPAERERIEALRVLRLREEAEAGASPTARRANTLPDQLHPVVRTHPVTGRKALYLNDEMTVGIDGMAQEEGVALLKALCAQATRPERVYRYRWRRGDVVAWDNASMLHAATYTDPRQPRTLYRLTVKGSEPF
jgi:taurine dioxygenase